MGCTCSRRPSKAYVSESPQGHKENSPLLVGSSKVLIVGDEIWSAQILNWLDNAECKQRLVTGYEDAGTNFTAFQPHYVILDLGIPEPSQTLRVLKAIKMEHKVTFIGIVKQSANDKEDCMNAALKSGFDRVLIEGEVLKQAPQRTPAMPESLFVALEKSRDLIIISDNHNKVQFVNGPCLQVLGYTRDEITGKDLTAFQDITPFLRQLERGFEWIGKIRWRTKSGDTLTLQCHAIPFSPGPGLRNHYLYLQDNPLETHVYPRGSLPSIRKGSYDLKSIISEGSARRQSLAKLYNLPLEAPITKVLSLLCAAQENAAQPVVQMLEQVMDILRTTELYTSHLKADNLRAEDPVTTNLIAALVSQGPPSAIMPRRSSNESAVSKKKQGTKKHSHLLLPMSRDLKEALEKLSAWDFDVLLVEKLTAGKPLLYIGMKIFANFNVHKTLGIDDRTTFGWLSTMEKHYKPTNTYHNSSHAADVLQVTGCFLNRLRVKNLLDPLDEACCLIAAAAHDLGHPGKSSAFLTNSGDELAILYNDVSILEQHHAALTFKLTLRDEKINIFKALDRKTYTSARACIIDMILATDMFKHFEHYTKFVTVFNKPAEDTTGAETKQVEKQDKDSENENGINPEDLMLIKRMLIKCADVSNPTRPLHLCKQWAKRIAEEYFAQTDEEKAKNLPVVMPLFDRSSCSIPVSQMGFMDYIVNNMFEEWDSFIEMPEMLYHLRKNYDYWKELHDKGLTGTEDPEKIPKNVKSEKVATKDFSVKDDTDRKSVV